MTEINNREVIESGRGRVSQIQPEDINAECHFFDAFDHRETEISAGWIVEFVQKRGTGWEPFTREDMDALHRAKFGTPFCFNRLIEPGRAYYIQTGYRNEGGGWIVERDGRLHFTTDFVSRCWKASQGSCGTTPVAVS